MSLRHVKLGICVSLCVSCVAFADRTLSRAEILDIFEKLTNQPMQTWISAGTIEAEHNEYRAAKSVYQADINSQISQKIEEYQSNPNKRELTKEMQEMKLEAMPFNVRYRLSNEYSMSSYVILKYDGERFYWEISVNSRSDSVRLPVDLEGNYMAEQFNLDWNAERVFAWDGRNYINYSLSGNQAVVDTTGDSPHVVNGPLTAGIIPWGYGFYTYDNLSASEVSALEVDLNGRTEVQLKLNNDGTEMVFSLEPEKDYAVLSCLITDRDSVIAKKYDNFRLIAGDWVPTYIIVDKYDDLASSLLSRDEWEFVNISGDVPAADSFNVDYRPGALVSYRSSETGNPLMFNYAKSVDIERLLTQSLDFTKSKGNLSQNCATAALGFAAMQLGKDIKNQRPAELVGEPGKMTSLYAMKKYAQGLGFNCRVVKTDLETLKDLSGCKAILHMPGKNHFVLLDHIDDECVWVLDLTREKFFYNTDINSFGTDWTEGTALLVSEKPVKLQGNFTEIADARLHNFVGAAGYTCTRIAQYYDVVFCPFMGGICADFYEEYYKRYGCEVAESGSCSSSRLLRMKQTPCINNPYYPMYCTGTGEWTFYYMWACN